MVIVGAGGFGREVWAIIEKLNDVGSGWAIEGFVDDSPTPEACELIAKLDSRIIGTVEDLQSRSDPFNCCLAIGSPAVRSTIRVRLESGPAHYPPIIHPDATLGHGVQISEGVIVAPGARLSTNVVVGPHVQIDQNATVGHDSTIDAFARLNPQACVSGAVRIGRGSLIGANATILQGLSVGRGAVVGAGSCVTRDVPDNTTVKGVPAR